MSEKCPKEERSKPMKGVLYVIIVDGEEVGQIRTLVELSSDQKLKALHAWCHERKISKHGPSMIRRGGR